MRLATTATVLFLAAFAGTAMAGVGPTLGEHEALEQLVADVPKASIGSVDDHGSMISAVLKYDGDFREAIDFTDRVMGVFSLTFVEKDWSILELEPDGPVRLERHFRGKSRPCGSVIIKCDRHCDLYVNFPFRCDSYPRD